MNDLGSVLATRRDFLKRSVAAGIAVALCKPIAGASAGNVQTILGPLDASRLGFTLPHEHIASAPDVLNRWPKSWGGRAGLIASAVDRLKTIKAAGVDTVVDLTPHDVGRDIRFLEEISRKSGMHVIACTGQRFLPTRSAKVSMSSRKIEGLAEHFTKEIDRGIDGTSFKAGVIKIGIGAARPTSLEEMGLRAAARAGKATGVPIRIHTNAADRAGESVAVILEDEGVSPARVSFDHSDDSGDLEYLLGLARRGYFLSMDHLHRGLMRDEEPSFERRVECIRKIIDAGFANRLFLSSDSMFGGSLLPEETRGWRENLDPPEGMLFIVRRLLPRLRELGVTEELVHVMTVGNARGFFSIDRRPA